MSAAVVQMQPARTTLIEIVDHLTDLFDSVDLCETPELRAECEMEIAKYLEAEIKKVDSICGYLGFGESQIEMHQKEAAYHAEQKRIWERRIERILACVQTVMNAYGKTKLEGRTSKLMLRACPASVEVLDVNLVPQTYMRITVEESVDRVAAKKAIQAGEEVPGVVLVTDRKSVVRK